MGEDEDLAKVRASIDHWLRAQGYLGELGIHPENIADTPEYKKLLRIIDDESRRDGSAAVKGPAYGDLIAELEQDRPRDRYVPASSGLGRPDRSRIHRDVDDTPLVAPDLLTLKAKAAIKERGWHVARWWFLGHSPPETIAYLVWCLEKGHDPETGARLLRDISIDEGLGMLPAEILSRYPTRKAQIDAYRQTARYARDEWRRAALTTLSNYRGTGHWARTSIPLWGFEGMTEQEAGDLAQAILAHIAASITPRRELTAR